MKRLTARLLAVALVAASARAADIRISDGTKVPVRLLQRISSETSKKGDIVNLEVAEDVSLDGTIIIKQSTPVRGTIVEAEPKRRMGRAGKLVFNITDTKAPDGGTVRLRSSQNNQGDSHVTGVVVTTTVIAVLVPVAAP